MLLDAAPKKDNSDTKSVASRTTLTLDEKESLRPDDSASMQAALEEDTFSPPGSVVANSRQGSDPDTHAFRAQLHQIGIHDAGRVVMPHAQRPEGLSMAEQRGAALMFPAPPMANSFVPSRIPSVDGLRPHVVAPSMWIVPPDEKLLEALASPKDRLFVLKVEQDLIDFIKDPKYVSPTIVAQGTWADRREREEFLQLPGTNSFYRMLSHKLADYYMLGHIVDDTMSSVRIFRTPHCRLPPPLIGSTPGTNNSTPPPSAQARKIMRRNRGTKAGGKYGDAEESFESFTSSKATSDVGSGGEDAKSAEKGALTREERESRYKEARARIFKDFEAKEQAEGTMGPVDLEPSRSSSTSGVKKNSAKKQKKPKDDGFEARSAFDPFGRRLSQHTFASADGHAYEQYAFDMDRQYTSNGQMLPSGAGFPGSYHMAAGSGPVMMNQWPQQNLPIAAYQAAQYPMPSPTHAHGPYAASAGFDGGQFSPQMGSEHTPKGTAPTLSGYGPGYIPAGAQMGWQQEGYMNPYAAPPTHQYPGYGAEYGGYYGNQLMQPASPTPYTVHPPQNGGGGFGQAYYADGFDMQPSFNPRSQAFVPGMPDGANAQFAPAQSMHFVPNMSGFQPQRQSSHTISQASFNASQQAQNGRAKGQGTSHPANGNRQQPPQQSTIAKWAVPATLPAKPPQPANGLPNVQQDSQQMLPPKPISTR